MLICVKPDGNGGYSSVSCTSTRIENGGYIGKDFGDQALVTISCNNSYLYDDKKILFASPVIPPAQPYNQCCYSSLSGICDTFPFDKSYTDSSKGLCSNSPHNTCSDFYDCNSLSKSEISDPITITWNYKKP